MSKPITYFLLMIFTFPVAAQVRQEFDLKKDFQYRIRATIDELTIDGQLLEETWKVAETGSDFWQKVPYFKAGADPRTEIKLAYDDKYLYVAAKCFQPAPLTITSLKRDEYWDNDGIAIVLDPLNTKLNAVLFGTSAVGVQWDATSTSYGDISSDWSNKWFVETHVTNEYWSAEFAIPLRILRYDPELHEWGMNFVRNLIYCNEYHNWTAVPEGFWPPNAAFAGSLVWDSPPEQNKGNFNLIPYVSTGVRQNAEENSKFDFDAGLDAKVALSSSLNLDLTINPDFSQIEVDELVTNLTRFDISLPEKRTFFLENADIFADFGIEGIRPFFSRRVGLNDELEAVPILYGLRATGNINKDNRIGIMNIHSQSTSNSLGQNQSALSYKRQFGRSYLQGLFLNRQAYDRADIVKNDFSRNLSLEGFYLSENGRLTLWGSTHGSMKEGFNDKNKVFNSGVRFSNANWTFDSDFVIFQENYFADLGFTARVNNYDAARDTTIRRGFNSESVYLEYQKRPRSGKIQRYQFDLKNETVLNSDWSFNETNTTFRYGMDFRNTAEFMAVLTYNDISLLYPFSFTGETPLAVDRYKTWTGEFSFSSDKRKNFSFDVSTKMGGFYNGTLTSFDVGANYRVQPWGNFSIGYQWNDLDFPDPYGHSLITAFISKVEIGFSRNLLWTTLFQYVEQSNYMGINSRLQWRFSPMSDLFLVYVDNYEIANIPSGASKLFSNNRALIFKVNYWY